ncbi:hypothetical protein [Mesorhizobium sp. WSM4312]|uniref:hypothetical protein n=1 Tax=Mesorhizobium sp. WSM4312 TaxID=2029411 RepID=UPI001FDFF23A|nr:hypothetical protein [Mesorhizobium sp. WSM4312]
MRKFFTSLFAFFISWFAGGLTALGLATATEAREEYILVFMASALVTIVVTIVFFVAKFFSNAPAIIDSSPAWSCQAWPRCWFTGCSYAGGWGAV